MGDTPPMLRGERVLLRPPRPPDKEDRQRLGVDADIVRMFGGDMPSESGLEAVDVDRWYEGIESTPLLWMIEHEGRFIGTVRLHNLDEHDRRAQVAIGILDPQLLGQGLGTEVLQLVIQFAFEVLELHRLSLRVLSYNARAIRSYEKCGFVREGVERQAALVDGVRHDDVIMGLLWEEWRR